MTEPTLTAAILTAATAHQLGSPTLTRNSFGIPSVMFPGVRGHLIWDGKEQRWYLCAGFSRKGLSLTKAVGGMIQEMALLDACNA